LNAAEFPHGPLEIVDEGVPMIVLLGTDASRFVAERARDFALRNGADVISIDLAELPGFHPLLAPFGAHLPLQWFNWYLGIEKNRPISTRRYMGVQPYAANPSA
jgi:fructoselysine 6-phosphate deglycase